MTASEDHVSEQIQIFTTHTGPFPPADKWLVLSLTQPWASALFIEGLKRVETRSWKTNYRGPLYIHAAKGFPKWAREFATEEADAGRIPERLPLGAIIGCVELLDVKRTEELIETLSETEQKWGDYGPKRYGWITANPVLLSKPIPAKGSLGLWTFNPNAERAV
jgi:activating signal cointegrator 1